MSSKKKLPGECFGLPAIGALTKLAQCLQMSCWNKTRWARSNRAQKSQQFGGYVGIVGDNYNVNYFFKCCFILHFQ